MRTLVFPGVASATLLLSSSAFAEILYRVTPTADGSKVLLEIEVPVKESSVSLQMPSWSPGAYAMGNYWEGIKDLSATDDSGASLSVAHPKPDTWEVTPGSAKRVKFAYTISQGAGRGFMGLGFDGKILHWGGPPVYAYVLGRKEESCRLELTLPAGWNAAIGLKQEKNSPAGTVAFQAKNYDVLADNPVTVGDFTSETYTMRGKEHQLNFRGPARDSTNRARAKRLCEFVTDAASDFFGGMPYDKYVFHFMMANGPDGGGGLEHATSAQMFAMNGLGPGSLYGICHEYFHLWNVKRIRSAPLGPFDYTQLPKTGALWWLEGVTDYYAHLIPYRYGGVTKEQFLAVTAQQIATIRKNPARLEVSPYDSSYRVSEAVGSFSSGYRVNYYPTGYVLGFLLDIELRARTQGKRSLDDVEKALWNLCKNDKPGFGEDEIRKQLIRFGGEGMGPLYFTLVTRPGELPCEEILAKAGLELVPGDRLGIREKADATEEQKAIRDGLLKSRPLVNLFAIDK